MKRTMMLLALVLTLTAACVFGAQAEGADAPAIGIIQLVQHVALDSAREGFVAALSDNGYVEGETVTIDVQIGQGDGSNLSTISDRFVSNNVDLVLAIGTDAAKSIAGRTAEIPILGTAITDYVSARLVESNDAPSYNVSGTSDMNPVAAQIALIQKLAPDTQTVGVLYNSGEDNSILQAAMAKEAIEALGMRYVEVTVTNSNDVQQATQSIVTQCDAIYIPTDNVFASAMPIVHGVTAESKTPVICGETGMVQSGGLATLGISYYDLGYQTGLMALEVLKNGADVSTMPIQFAGDGEYAINGEIAAEIGMEIPEELQPYVF